MNDTTHLNHGGSIRPLREAASADRMPSLDLAVQARRSLSVPRYPVIPVCEGRRENISIVVVLNDDLRVTSDPRHVCAGLSAAGFKPVRGPAALMTPASPTTVRAGRSHLQSGTWPALRAVPAHERAGDVPSRQARERRRRQGSDQRDPGSLSPHRALARDRDRR